jgi:hypothetical protein
MPPDADAPFALVILFPSIADAQDFAIPFLRQQVYYPITFRQRPKHDEILWPFMAPE